MTDGARTDGKTDILLVDDNHADIARVLSVLKKAKITNRTHVLTEGGQILDFLFRNGQYQDFLPLPTETLILLSLKINGGRGLEILRKVKTDERSRNFPVVLLTSTQEDRGVMEGYKIGANACVVQPIDLTKFIEAVAELRLGWLLIAAQDKETGSFKSG